MLPPKIYLQSTRVAQFNEVDQDEVRELDANLLEEEWDKALSSVKKYRSPSRATTTKVSSFGNLKLVIWC
jgi:hypothetical protein